MVAECAVLGILGGIGGVVVGIVVGGQLVTVGIHLVTGWRLPFALPAGPVLAGVVLAATVSALAGWVPARAAARLEARHRSVD